MAGRAAPTDAATRAHALALADEHGYEEAARRTGFSASTLRVWKYRASESAADDGRVAEPAGRSPEELRADAARARAAEAQAVGQSEKLLGQGKTTPAKTAIEIADRAGARALMLERAAREAESHQARLRESEDRLSKLDNGLARTFASYLLMGLGLPVTAEVERALWAAAGHFAEHGERRESGSIRAPRSHPEPETAAARAVIDRALRARYRAELVQEFGIPEEQAAYSEADLERELEAELDEALRSPHVRPQMRQRIESEGRGRV